ncbi:MAG: hypothetical protein ABIR83_14180 [Nakamurella sp.]
MTTLDEVGDRDGWRCWLCDEPVDPAMSVNDARGPSVDTRGAAVAKAKKNSGVDPADRLAHRACNTRKGAVEAVVPWPSRLFVADPAPLIGVAERLARKGGREVVARCPSRADADATAEWLVDRFVRLTPGMPATASVEPGGGQFVVALSVPRRR